MDQAIEVVVVLTAVISVIVSLVNAVTSTRQGAFAQLKEVVERLEKDLTTERTRGDKLEKELEVEKERNDQLEADLRKVTRWSHKLVRQLKQANIEPVGIDDTEDKINVRTLRDD